jgi:hypothetical protein
LAFIRLNGDFLLASESILEGNQLIGWEKRIREIESCRICGNRSLEQVIDLGMQSLASLFDDGRPRNQLATPVPLSVVRCNPLSSQRACGFVQLKHTVPPDVMFRDYGYRSGINTTMRLHLQDLVRDVEGRAGLQEGDVVVDIGANDGTTLLAYRTEGLLRVGFEPSDACPQEPHPEVRYVRAFFNSADFRRGFPNCTVRVVTAIAMFYDIDDPVRFCQEVSSILADDGLWVIEMGYWADLLANNGFDSMCHEHLGYYSLKTLQFLLEKTGLLLEDISFNSANGGSLRCYIRQKTFPGAVHLEKMAQALRREEETGIHLSDRFELFRNNARTIRQELQGILAAAHRAGKKVYGYRASTKGNVLLQYAGITANDLVAIADRNPAKRGRLTPGTRVPICTEDEMRQSKPDYLLVLPWHFLPEFMEREKGLRLAGTKFIVPLPEVRIV